MKFIIFVIFNKTLLEQSIWIHYMQMSELMSSPHNFPCILFTEMIDNPIFQVWQSKTCLISTLDKCRIMFALIYFMGTCFYMFEQKMKIFTISYIQNTWTIVRWWHNQLTHFHIHIHIECSRNVSLKITKIKNFISSLFFIRFTSNFRCSIRNVLLFNYWINLNLDSISPLSNCTVHLPCVRFAHLLSRNFLDATMCLIKKRFHEMFTFINGQDFLRNMVVTFS